jgi:acyl-CoA reductase-like NAD-dependent aldehyde dehydrogenase
MGKPYKQSLKEISTALSLSSSLLSLAPSELADETIEITSSSLKKVTKEPVGPVFLLSPYNFPILSVISSLVPALVSGNPVLIKSSPYTPLSVERFVKAFEATGVSGLVQSCFTDTAATLAMLTQPRLGYVHLVGHSDTGRTLYREIAHRSFIDIGLFLSAHNAVYVAEDANLAQSVSQIMKSAMDNAGQSSYRYSRVFVHKAVSQEFINHAEPIIRSFSIGDPMDEMTTLGPMTEPDAVDEMVKKIEEATASGAEIECGGNATNDENGRGRFFEPTIVVNVDDSLSLKVGTR